jgi:hypothetical protein
MPDREKDVTEKAKHTSETENKPVDDTNEELSDGDLDKIAGGEKVQFGSSS